MSEYSEELAFEMDERPLVLMNLLKLEGLVPSGGQAKVVIDSGLVEVNGEVELRKRRQLSKGDVVTFQGVRIFLK